MFAQIRARLVSVVAVLGLTAGLLSACSDDSNSGSCFGLVEQIYSASDVTESACHEACPTCAWTPN